MYAHYPFSTLSVLLAYLNLAFAQQSIVYPTTAAASATPLPSLYGYTYAGCYNETTGIPGAGGARALDQMTGKSEVYNNMTTTECISFCLTGMNNNGSALQYAGLEYGRECYCSSYLSSLSDKLNSSRCEYACDGNSSEVCGGSLAITLYNLTDASKTGQARSLEAGPVVWYAFAAVVTLLAAALM